MELKEKRVLVTGDAGFIGRNLVEELKKQRAEVLTLTDGNGYSIDIRDWQKVKRIGKMNIVYHLAAIASGPYSFENPRETYEVNVAGSLNILELCRLRNVERIVLISSYVYGHPQYLPIDEKHVVNPTNPYARSKALSEELCKAYYKDYGLKCVIVRPFNIYGEGQSESFLIPRILRKLEHKRIELNDPEPKRDFLYVTDAVEALIKAGEYDGAAFDIFNIGFGASYSVDEIVKKLITISGRRATASYRYQRRKNEILDVIADISKAKQKLTWEPKVTIDKGLRNMVASMAKKNV
ncbi:NAD-dependent epimerase/dehydratase family protein [Chloroflexota bacterium]